MFNEVMIAVNLLVSTAAGLVGAAPDRDRPAQTAGAPAQAAPALPSPGAPHR